ncbi:MAG: hypothetical protein GY764_09630 [Halieaceae bacterium]|nr:hypothetical protein [Halieaceae bacterium]
MAATSTAETLEEALDAAFPVTPEAEGELIFVTGRVLDVNGAPIADAAVEFWQTDVDGVYDHPGDPTTASRDPAFQFYGTSITGADGRYNFRTVAPGYYEPRPRHIHLKVKRDGATVLTSQFYFEEDRESLANEGLFAQAGEQGDLLVLAEVDRADLGGVSVSILANDLVIDTGIGAGELTLTPSQGEGPYYPLVNVADYDNDLTVVP